MGQNFHFCSWSEHSRLISSPSRSVWLLNIRFFTTPLNVELKQCPSSGLNLYMFSKVMHVLYFRFWVWVCAYSVCCVINSPGAIRTSEIKLRGKLLHNCSRLSNLETLQTQSSTALELVFLLFVCLFEKSFHWVVFAYLDYYFNYDFGIILLICWWPCWSWFIPQQLLESIQVHTWRCTPLSEPTIPPWGISSEVFTASALDFVLICVFVKGASVWERIEIGKNALDFPIISSYPYF